MVESARGEGGGEPDIAPGLGLHPLDTAGALQTGDPGMGQRTGQPVESGERRPVVQYRGDPDHDGKAEMASGHHL